MHPQKGAGGVCPSLLSWMQAPCPEGHHKSLIIYDEPNRVLHPASWLVSVLYTLWPPFFRAYRDFFRWAIGHRAEDFPFGWSSQAVKEGEDWRLLFLEFCHRSRLLSPALEVGKGQKIRPLLAYFLLFSLFLLIHCFQQIHIFFFWVPTTCKESPVGDTAVNETEFWFSRRLHLHKVSRSHVGGQDTVCRLRRRIKIGKGASYSPSGIQGRDF